MFEVSLTNPPHFAQTPTHGRAMAHAILRYLNSFFIFLVWLPTIFIRLHNQPSLLLNFIINSQLLGLLIYSEWTCKKISPVLYAYSLPNRLSKAHAVPKYTAWAVLKDPSKSTVSALVVEAHPWLTLLPELLEKLFQRYEFLASTVSKKFSWEKWKNT